jgi:valyl-tRNA synthetase
MKPHELDAQTLQYWEAQGVYRYLGEPPLDKPLFAAVVPAPNPTGALHMGHALNWTLQDILCRWYRLLGREIVWEGALDHGSFSTQTVVEREMLRQGINPREVGRDARQQALRQWIDRLTPQVIGQLKQFGVSASLERTVSMWSAFNTRLFQGFLVELHRKGIFYEADAVTDYCPHCRTSLDKVDQEPAAVENTLYSVRLRCVDEPQLSLTVVTASPETLHTDVALAVASGDSRYAAHVGKRFKAGFGRPVPVVAVKQLPPQAVQGLLRVTPGHCAFSYRLAKAEKYEAKRAYDERGVMTGGPFAGKPRQEARALAVKALREAGALVRELPEKATVPGCRKCNKPIEQFMSRQWFVAIGSLLEPTLERLETGRARVFPPRHEEHCKAWLRQCIEERRSGSLSGFAEDWCVSRQIECGNVLPVYRCRCGTTEVAMEPPACGACGGAMQQVEDVLDIRLADVLWCFATGRNHTQDVARLEAMGKDAICVTGMDLLLFWVMSTIMVGCALESPTPFRDAIVHPLVCDAQGRKMGKSIGNVIVPTELIQEYGADCMRLALLDGLEMQSDKLPFSHEKMGRNRKLLDELLEAATRLAGRAAQEPPAPPSAWFTESVERIGAWMARYDLDQAHQEVRALIARLISGSQGGTESPGRLLRESLMLMHPFLPLTSEWLWRRAFPREGALAALRLS